jgi:hypothetical protein
MVVMPTGAVETAQVQMQAQEVFQQIRAVALLKNAHSSISYSCF